MGVDCLKCINSACCRLVVEVSSDEYKEYEKKGLESNFKTHIDDFLNRFPRLENKKEYLKKHYNDNYAELNKNKDGFCVLLDEKTKLCSIYEDRPKVCRDYENNRCLKIRELCTN
jgi:Fe-S-cluster containining protein